jgi:D-threonate/D-erythronate kinase
LSASATSLRFGIVADDITGALDSAVAFCGRGYEVTVRLPGSSSAQPAAGSVLAVVSGARDAQRDRARELIRLATATVMAADPDELMIKVDSQLRGYPAAQLAHALTRSTPSTIALVAPAFPRMGRTTVDGIQRIDSPLASGAVGRAAVSVSDALCDGTLPFARLGLSEIRADDQLTGRLLAMRDAGIRIVIADAENEDDLERIVAAGRQQVEIIWVGSGGLAAALAGGRHAAPAVAAHLRSRERTPSNILVLAGSAARETAQQVSVLSRGRAPVITIAPQSKDIARRNPIAEIRAALAENHLATVSTGCADEDRLHPSHAANLATIVADLAADVDGIVVSGGETLLNLLVALGIGELTVVGEIETGVPLSLSRGPLSLAIASKAGAFGDEHALERAVEFLSAQLEGSNQ